MALINCPECNREISDKVMACPHCGYPLEEQKVEQADVQKDQVSSIKPDPIAIPKKRLMIIIGGCVLGVILLITVGLIISNEVKRASAYTAAQQLFDEAKYSGAEAKFLELGDYKDSVEKAEQSKIRSKNSYIDNLEILRYMMLDGASNAETLCNLTAKVWSNTIYETSDAETNKYTIKAKYYKEGTVYYNSYDFENDFNTSLAKLFIDEETQLKIQALERNQTDVQSLLKQLKNPTEEFSKCYDTVNDLYGMYKGLTDLAINPSGSYSTFTENKNNKTSSFLEYFSILETQIPEREEVESPIIGDNDYFRSTRWGMTIDEVKNIEADYKLLENNEPNKLNYLVNDYLMLDGIDVQIAYTFNETSNKLESAMVYIAGDELATQTKALAYVFKYRDMYGEYEDPGYLGGIWGTEHSIIKVSYVMEGLISISYEDKLKAA